MTALTLSDFDYYLPEDLIAQFPAAERSDSRLLIVDRKRGSVDHTHFSQISHHITTPDTLVVNDTKVSHARLNGRRATGGKIEVLLLEKLPGTAYRGLLKPSARIKVGDEITFDSSDLKAVLKEKVAGNNIVEFCGVDHIADEIHRIGKVPLPPYIKRKAEELDDIRYQTVYAKHPGAVAAPTAGLHFTNELLAGLKEKGVDTVAATLHVSYGTFSPVRSDLISNHKMQSEYFEIGDEAAGRINGAKSGGARIIAVGTTVCRILESSSLPADPASGSGKTFSVKPTSGSTDIFIYPPYRFKMVDALITNFHLPKSTLLMLVSAFAGRELIMEAYAKAIEKGYRFFSYGDAMLIV